MEKRLDLIKEKDVVIVQRGSYFKACRITSKRPQRFGRQGEGQVTIDLGNACGRPFGSAFKLIRDNKNLFKLEYIEEQENSSIINSESMSGEDNRNIFDDGNSQSLTKSDIRQLVDSGISGNEVIATITTNSKTFNSKTKYSQEKYVNKKMRKYDEFITLQRPSIRLLSHTYYTSQDPLRISNLRIDTLSQILSYVNVKINGNYVVYEAGIQGLISAAVLNVIRSQGSLVHVYSGLYPHREAVELMEFSFKELESLYFLSSDNLPSASKLVKDSNDNEDEKNTVELGATEGAVKSPEGVAVEEIMDIPDSASLPKRKYARSRDEDSRLARDILEKGVHGLIVSSRQHSSAVTLALLPYLLPGHSFAVFSPYKEILMDLFVELKQQNCINIHLVENWLRNYQVLPDRTHPEVNMSGGGGYVLYGWKVDNK